MFRIVKDRLKLLDVWSKCQAFHEVHDLFKVRRAEMPALLEEPDPYSPSTRTESYDSDLFCKCENRPEKDKEEMPH